MIQLPKYVVGDSGRFRQVVVNLVGNAIKFTSKGSVQINVVLEYSVDRDFLVRVEVVDSGIGISTETIGGLFQAFAQADASMARRYGGSGLGLSICKGLTEKMGGQIGVNSLLGNGSTFWFTCKLQIAAAPQLEFETPALSEAVQMGGRILLAEDNTINQMIAVRILEKYGFRTDVVANGSEALKALASLPYDLILMDCQMPEMDGYEATQLIRLSKSLPNPNIPIVAMTANAMQGDADKCLASGMNDYISKPVKAERLVQIVWKNLVQSKIKAA